MESTFKKITPDGEVDSIDDVEIQESIPTTEQKVWTLRGVDQVIANLQAEVAKFEAIRASIEPEAEKVKLKTAEPELEE